MNSCMVSLQCALSYGPEGCLFVKTICYKLNSCKVSLQSLSMSSPFHEHHFWNLRNVRERKRTPVAGGTSTMERVFMFILQFFYFFMLQTFLRGKWGELRTDAFE